MASNLQRFLSTDENKETKGVWKEIGGGISLLVARQGNENYRAAMARETEPHREQLANGTLPDDIWEDLVLRVIAETVLLGWSGVCDDDGSDVPYSIEQAYEFLCEMKELRERVAQISGRMENYRKYIVQGSIKN